MAENTNGRGKITATSGLAIKVYPNISSKRAPANAYSYGTIITWDKVEFDINGSWYHTPDGWVYAKYVSVLESEKVTEPVVTRDPVELKAENDVTMEEYTKQLTSDQVISEAANTVSSISLQSISIPSCEFIWGLPAQFPKNVDRRLPGDFYGMHYTEEYLSQTPIVVFTPCRPKILPTNIGEKINTFFTKEKSNRDKILAALSSEESKFIDALANSGIKQMKYFTTVPAYNSYMADVNTCCRLSAKAIGLGDYVYKGVKLGQYDWSNENVNAYLFSSNMKFIDVVRSLAGTTKSVSFAYEPNNSESGNFSNSTSESTLSGSSKAMSAKAREAEFVIGAGAGVAAGWTADGEDGNLLPEYADLKKYDSNSIMGRISGAAATISTGMQLVLPEIWNDSYYSPSYGARCTLRATHGTRLSKYLEVLVPFWHLLCLGGPKMIQPNSYASPYLCRTYSKGYFDIEYGMLDSLSYTKFGDGEDIGPDGIPTHMEIDLSFKNLYNTIGITNYFNLTTLFNNTGLLDYIGTTSGLNMNREDVLWKFLTIIETGYGAVKSTPGYILHEFQEKVRRFSETPLGGK